jgi:hypothetical protein
MQAASIVIVFDEFPDWIAMFDEQYSGVRDRDAPS